MFGPVYKFSLQEILLSDFYYFSTFLTVVRSFVVNVYFFETFDAGLVVVLLFPKWSQEITAELSTRYLILENIFCYLEQSSNASRC